MAGGGGGARSWSAEDEAIIATNTEASECKRGAVELGYWPDPYVAHFARRAERKPPEINRGYYARVKGIELFVHQFLERCGPQCQIINLGCGFDTLYWRLRDSTRAVANFIELDLPAVTAKKCHIIKRNKQLLEKISSEDGEVSLQGGDLHADGYHLVGCDLRCAGAVSRALSAAQCRPALPTLALAECVLVYLRGDAAAALVAQLAETFAQLALVSYEQCSLGDAFGAVMCRSLAARGVGAPGPQHEAGPREQAARLEALGFARAAAWDMRCVWRALPDADRARAERLEPLDEHELLHQLHAHYALTLATRGHLCADMDLHA